MLVLRLLGALAFLAPLALYLASCGGYPAFWDTGELQTVPYILGIAHPTGFPLFTLVGWAFSHALPIGSVAWRMNAMCAFASAGAAWMAFRVAVRLGAFPPLALVGAWWFACGSVVWTRAVRADVHDLALLLATLAIACALEYHLDGDPRMLRWSALWFGLGLANHPIALWLAPGLVVVAFARGRRVEPRAVAACAAIVAACLALYAYLPIRSAMVTAAGLDPTRAALGIRGGFLWDYNHPASWQGFLAEVSGSQFGAGATVGAAFDLGAYPGYARFWLGQAAPELGIVGLALAAIGIVVAGARERRAVLGLVLAAFAAVPFAVAFREVEADVARYFLLSFWLLGVGIGLWIPSTWFATGTVTERTLAWATLAVTVIAGVAALRGNAWIAGLRNDHGAQSVIDTVRAATPADAIVVAPWLDATPLGYAAYVEHSMGRRLIVSAWPDGVARQFPQWLRRRPVYLALSGTPQVAGVTLRRVSSAFAPIGVYEVNEAKR
ncbi:MAG TPA: DUF2723 domain-containing protein [Candidatus Dormibacteraeota bacterium]|nr:DUF2723 domain-containing protein [Candidatus Dormibacteraeota bacterium]